MVKKKLTYEGMSPEEIVEDLQGYSMIKDVRKLKQWDRIKYIRKDNGHYKRGGYLFIVDKKKGYLMLESLKKTNPPIRWSVQIDEVILFRKDEV